MLSFLQKMICNKDFNQIFGIFLLIVSSRIAELTLEIMPQYEFIIMIFPFVVLYFIIWSFIRFSGIQSRLIILIVALQFFFYFINKVRMEHTTDHEYDINAIILSTILPFILFIVLVNLLIRSNKGTVLMKLCFYILIAFFTTAIAFNLGPFGQGIDCIQMETYEMFQKCKIAFGNFDLLKSNLINVLVICVSIFEAISNAFELSKRNSNA